MTETNVETDVAIIGAGPVGLFAVFECGMLDLKCCVIDTLEACGGQCVALYPEKPIFDIPAYPRIDAQELIDRLVEQAEPFEPAYQLGQQVVTLEPKENRWRLETSAGTKISAGAVIIAAGAGVFGPNRPPLEGLATYEAQGPGLGVKYLVRSRDDFVGKRIVIAGGGDSAVDWALSLSEVAESIAVVHRRPKFRAAPDSVNKMKALADAGRLDLVVPYQLAAVEGEGGVLSQVRVRDLDGGERALSADVLLPFYGMAADPGPIGAWNLDMEGAAIRVEASTMNAGHPGLFAVGDIVAYPGKLKLILTGFAEAALAAHEARKTLFPDEVRHFEYSTTKGLPGTG